MSSPGPTASADRVLLRIRELDKSFNVRQGWRTRKILALHGINLDIRRGSILAIVGHSGSGKTTLARCIAGMEHADGGSLTIDGVEHSGPATRDAGGKRFGVQLIFQDASTALNPRFTAEELIVEPMVIQRRGDDKARRERASALMREVGLSPEWRLRRPSEFSGGQLQRIAIARALAAEPRLLILDEAFTGLDVSTAAQIANLLLELREIHDLTYILISHDIALAARFSDEIAVMSAGTLVEHGAAQSVCGSPQHSATQNLLQTSERFAAAFENVFGAGA